MDRPVKHERPPDASPVHGGNYDKSGWKLVQYDDTLNHKPPFGYYDRDYPGFVDDRSGRPSA